MHGIIPALVTAYDSTGAISTDRTGDHVDRLVRSGVHGIFACGSTGEALLQTEDERRALLETIVERVDGRVPVMAHVGAMDTATTTRLARHAVTLGVEEICAITPPYFEYDEAAHAAHVEAVADAAGRPVVVYHIPSRTGAQLGLAYFERLANRGVLSGVKYSSTDLYLLAELVRALPEEVAVFHGSDEVLLGGLALGASGAIGSTYNIMPATFVALLEAFRRGDLEAARAYQASANAAIETMHRYDFLLFIREVSRLQGIDLGESRAPLPTATPDERAEIARAVVGLEALTTQAPRSAVRPSATAAV